LSILVTQSLNEFTLYARNHCPKALILLITPHGRNFRGAAHVWTTCHGLCRQRSSWESNCNPMNSSTLTLMLTNHRLVSWLVFNGTFSTNRLYCAIGVRIYHVRPG